MLTPDHLTPHLHTHYALPPSLDLTPILPGGFNDHYLLTTPDAAYVLRLYRPGWRTSDEVAYELAVLTHLTSHDVPVCAPIPLLMAPINSPSPPPKAPASPPSSPTPPAKSPTPPTSPSPASAAASWR